MNLREVYVAVPTAVAERFQKSVLLRFAHLALGVGQQAHFKQFDHHVLPHGGRGQQFVVGREYYVVARYVGSRPPHKLDLSVLPRNAREPRIRPELRRLSW